MTVLYALRNANTQVGFYAAAGSAYTVAENATSFAPDQTLVIRFATGLIKGSVLNSAVLKLEVTAKNTANAGTSYHTIRAEYTGDSDRLNGGSTADSQRPKTAASVPWTCVYPANPPGPVIYDIDVKSLLLEIMANPEFVTGSAITFFIKCDNENGTDNGIIMNNEFSQLPMLTLDFTPPENELNDVNFAQNSAFNPKVDGIESGNPFPPFWRQNEFFGLYVPPANQGSMVVDNAFTRLPGVPTLKYTTGPAHATLRTGPSLPTMLTANESYVYSGWIYIDPAIPTTHDVWCEIVFYGVPTLVIIPERGIWVPFCTKAYAIDTVQRSAVLWPTVGINFGYTQGWNIWISEPTILKSKHRQMPFNGVTPAKGEIVHSFNKSRQTSSRRLVPRRSMMVNGVLKRMPTWAMRPNQPIFELVEPVKGGPQIGQLPAAQTIGGLPAGMTVTELL